jgi:hypothetical protein
MLSRIARVGIFFVPPILIGVLSASYLNDCFELLQSPGVGLKIPHETPGGTLTVESRTLSLNVARGTVELRGLKVTKPDGKLLAGADRVFATGLTFLTGLRPNVLTESLRLNAVRLEDGTFEHEKFFPPEEKGGDPVTLRFEGRDTLLTLQDRTAIRMGAPNAKIFRLAGKRWVGSLTDKAIQVRGDVRVNNLLSGVLDLRTTQKELPPKPGKDFSTREIDGAIVRVRSLNLNASQLLEDARAIDLGNALDALKPLRLEQTGVQGEVTAWFRPGQPLELSGQAKVNAQSIAFAQDSVQNLDLDLELRGQSIAATGKGIARSQGLRLPLNLRAIVRGDLSAGNIQNVVASGSLQSTAFDWKQITGLAPQVPKQLRVKNLRLASQAAEIRAQDPTAKRPGPMSVTARLKVEADEVAYEQFAVQNPRAEVDLSEAEVHASLTGGEFSGSSLTADVRYGIQQSEIDGFVRANGLILSRLPVKEVAQRAKGRVNAFVALSGTASKPQAEFRVLGRASVSGLGDPVLDQRRSHGVVQAAGVFDGNRLSIDRVNYTGPLGIISAKGWLDLNGGLAINTHARAIPLREFQSEVSGTVDVFGRITGSTTKPVAAGRIEAFRIGSSQVKLPSARARFLATLSRVRVTDIEAYKGTGLVEGAFDYVLKNEEIAGKLSVRGLQIADISELVSDGDEPPFNALIDIPSVRVEGTVKNPKATASFTVTDLLGPNVRVDKVAGSVTFENSVAVIEPTQVSLAGGGATISGRYDVQKNQGVFTANWKDVGIRPLLAPFVSYLSLQGTVAGRATVRVNNKKLAEVSADGQLTAVKLNQSTPIDGEWSFLRAQNGVWSGQAIVGEIGRFVEINAKKFEQDTGNLEVSVGLLKMPLRELLLAGIQPKEIGRDESLELVKKLGGEVSGAATLVGQIDLGDSDPLRKKLPAVPPDDGVLEKIVPLTKLLPALDDVPTETAAGDIKGRQDRLFIYGGSLFINDLALGANVLGNLKSTFDYEQDSIAKLRRFMLKELSIKGDPLNLVAKGELDLAPNGNVALSADLLNLDAQLFSEIAPQVKNFNARLDALSLEVSGKREEPVVQGSASATLAFRRRVQEGAPKETLAVVKKSPVDILHEGLLASIEESIVAETPTSALVRAARPKREEVTLASNFASPTLETLVYEPMGVQVIVPPFKINKEGISRVKPTGHFRVNLLEGDFKASVPISGAEGVEMEEPVSAEIALASRPLNDLIDLIPVLNVGTAKSEIRSAMGPNGKPIPLRLSGTLAKPKVEGAIELYAEELQFVGGGAIAPKIDPSLRNVLISLKVEDPNNPTARLDVTANSRQSAVQTKPNLVAFLEVPIRDLLETPDPKAKAGTRERSPLEGRPVKGSLAMDLLDIRQSFADGSFGELRLNTPSPVVISGTAESPSIVGRIELSKVKTAIPPFAPSEGGGEAPPVDPRFDLTLALVEPAEIRVPLARLQLEGAASIKGQLTKPIVRSELVVRDGSVNLPGGEVKVDRGGTISLIYEAKSELAVDARLETNMVGRTRITTLRNNAIPERYEAILTFRGNLLVEEGLQYTAISEPAGLTQQEIINRLGRIDLIESLAAGQSGGDFNRDLQNMVTAFAVPTLTGGLTNPLSKSLGFDYLTIDYNGVEQFSAAAAKSFGSSWFFFGRTQLSEPLPGQPQQFDYRFVYRPRQGSNFIQSLSFSLGFDQDRPYKLSIDYSNRFGTGSYRMKEPMIIRGTKPAPVPGPTKTIVTIPDKKKG